jgi:hypothetical protein
MNLALRVTVLVLLAAPSAPAGFGAAPAEATDAPVKMAPFRVEDSSLHFGFGLSTWLDQHGVRHAMITRVDRGSLAESAGLLVADRLISVDGKPVAACDTAGLMKLFSRTTPPGHTMSWTLTIGRGVSGKLITVKLQARAGAVGPDLPAGGPLVITQLAPDGPVAKPASEASGR